MTSSEIERVLGLPRREPLSEQDIDHMTALLRTRPGDRLWRSQAEALSELYHCRGLFGAIPVGRGKTLISLLAPTLLGAQRPVLLIPAGLRDKTRDEYVEYARDGWRVRLPRLISYDEMGLSSRDGLLEELQPDLVIADEAHHLRRTSSGRSRKIGRYIRQYRPIFAPMSGTMLTEKLLEYWHLAVYSLNELAPVTRDYEEAQEWDEAMRTFSGFGIPNYHEHFRTSRGVVIVPGSGCPASLEIRKLRIPLSAHLKELIDWVLASHLRPDMEPLDEWGLPTELGRLALGFWHRWNPLPPEWWRRPRKAWCQFERAVLDLQHPDFDTPEPIRTALDTGRPCPGWAEGRARLDAWRAVKDEFVPNPEAVWVDDGPLARIAEHAKKHRAIVWVRNTAAGEALERHGLPWYPGGTNPQRATPGTPIACQIEAHATGRNLQGWSHAIVAQLPADNRTWEQIVGRHHRPGQKADRVTIDVVCNLDYHERVLSRVRDQAHEQARWGSEKKLGVATWI